MRRMNAVVPSTRCSAAAFGPCWQKSDQSIYRLIIAPHFPETIQKVYNFQQDIFQYKDVRLGKNSFDKT